MVVRVEMRQGGAAPRARYLFTSFVTFAPLGLYRFIASLAAPDCHDGAEIPDPLRQSTRRFQYNHRDRRSPYTPTVQDGRPFPEIPMHPTSSYHTARCHEQSTASS